VEKMGKIFEPKQYSINDFRAWYERKELILSPKFQRRRVWSEKAKSYLIDTILRGLPIPPVFIREKIDIDTSKSIREVIDGQQRLRAILDFLSDGFKVLKIHNEEFGGRYFSELPDKIKEEFLKYNIVTNVVTTPEDKDVLGIFARLNTYTVPLNKTELLNAKYFGIFKQTVHQLAYEFNTFWVKSKILSEYKIARMYDVELTTELVIASIDGIKEKKAKFIENYYKIYDDNFPFKKQIEENFRNTIDTIDEIYGDVLPNSLFSGTPLFYSLYCLIYDLLFGLKNSDNKMRIQEKDYLKIRNALEDLESILESASNEGTDGPESIRTFIEDYTRHTTLLKVRLRRHKFLLSFIAKYLK